MNPLKKLASQTAIYGIPTIVGRLLNYLLVPLYTYNFSTDAFGVYTELYAYVSFLLIVLTYGLETALFNFSRLEADKEKVYSTILISVTVSSIIFLSFASLFSANIASFIRYPQHPEYISWFAFILTTDSIAAIAFAKLREQQKAKKFAFIRSVNIMSNIGLNLFFIVWCPEIYDSPSSPLYEFVASFYNPETGVGYAFISNLIASVLTLLLLLPGIVKINLNFEVALWKKIMSYSLPLLIAGLAGMTNETFDRAVLKYLLPANISSAQLGIYGACYKISIIMTIFIQTFRYAAEPFFFSHASSGNAKQMYADVMKYFVIICSLIFLATMMNISWIQYFVGKDYRIGIKVVPILLIANMLLGIFFNLSIWYKLTNQTKFGAWLMLFGAVVTLAGNFIFVPEYGYMASAWTTLVCYALMVILSYIIGNKHYPVNYNLASILGYLCLSVLLYIISSYLSIESLFIKNGMLAAFIVVVFILEKKSVKKLITSNLQLHENKNHK